MSNLRYTIRKNKLEYDDNGIPIRKYSNLDPPGDRDTYEKLQINDPYKGYKDVVYTPVDMPNIDVDTQQVYDLWDSAALEKDYPGTTFGCEHGSGKVLFLKHNMFGHPLGDGEWFGWVDKEMPHIKKFIQQLPFKTIRQCSFVQPTAATVPHYDEPINMVPYLREGAPCQYRIRWSKVTEPDNEVFFLSRDSGATKIYPVLPKTTNTFVYDGSVYEHGADRGFNFYDRCQIVISGTIDVPKHHQILEKSIEKYKEYVIYDKDFR